MKHILEFVINANHTNVILMSAPHTYDFIRNSCVNNEVKVFNVVSERNLAKAHNVGPTWRHCLLCLACLMFY